MEVRKYIVILFLFMSQFSYAADERQKDKSLVDEALKSALADQYISDEEYANLEGKYNGLINKYPNWYAGYDGLTTLSMFKGDCNSAIQRAKNANSKQPNLPSFYALTVCYTKLEQYQYAIEAANSALSLDDSILNNTQFLIFSALSYTEVGKYEVAMNLLGMALKANPEIKSNTQFLSVGKNLATRMQEKSGAQ
ncbi:MAG: hypothetical protein DIZ78_06485 [endosymbiont of Escarpia spicata]|uniref:Uncharacterized protein n=1 Tax=endosymbiont of Escarpia spicata TaxID=2200908 RepID=A0A370DNQ2_9GAMM|nr:MAG: hypothetical protein DIZ78_06485 [endosymbiont of Escarpia spicata]